MLVYQRVFTIINRLLLNYLRVIPITSHREVDQLSVAVNSPEKDSISLFFLFNKRGKLGKLRKKMEVLVGKSRKMVQYGPMIN